MRLDQLISGARYRDGHALSFQEMHTRTDGTPSLSRLIASARPPDEWITVPWTWRGKPCRAAARKLPEPHSLMGFVDATGKSPLAVGLAALESGLGIPVADELDAITQRALLLPDGWHAMNDVRFRRWCHQGEDLIGEEDRDRELETLRTRCAALEAKLSDLRAATRKGKITSGKD